MDIHNSKDVNVHRRLNTLIRKEQIVEAALDIIVNQGLQAMTIVQIADSVGLVPSGIYRHFKNKDEIVEAILKLIERKLLENVQKAYKEEKNSIKCLRHILIAHVQMIHKFQILPRLLFSNELLTRSSGIKNKVYHVFRSYLNALERIIQRGQLTGEIRADIAAETLAVMFIGIFQPPAFIFLLNGGNFDVIKQTDEAWSLFSQAIQAM